MVKEILFDVRDKRNVCTREQKLEQSYKKEQNGSTACQWIQKNKKE
jgi:hypothetical protein